MSVLLASSVSSEVTRDVLGCGDLLTSMGDLVKLVFLDFRRLGGLLAPPSRVVGSGVATDPRGEPLPLDQSSFSARRRSVAIFGDIIKNPVCVFSAFHPGSRNGKDISKVGQRFTP